MTIIIIKEQEYEQWKNYIENVIKFLQRYQLLLNAYVLDFFIDDLWNSMNAGWITAMLNWSCKDLSQFLQHNHVKKNVLPLSFIAFKACCKCFSLPRHPSSDGDSGDIQEFFTRQKVSLTPSWHKSCSNEPKPSSVNLPVLKLIKSTEQLSEEGQHRLLSHVFRNHLKPKKQHEVVRLAYAAAVSMRSTNADVMIDVGCGQGHLSRLMAYGYQIPVICLDSQNEFILGARKFDQQLEKFMAKGETLQLPKGPRHSTFHIGDQDNDEFSMMINKIWPELSQKGCKKANFNLVGLHTCGDLASSMLNLFCSSPNAHSIMSVGCCYMKLSDTSPNNNSGYPISEVVRNSVGHELSYAAREMACHAIETYSKRLQSGADNLKVHCYRSVLETVLVKKDKTLKHEGLRPVKNAHLLPFSEYAIKTSSRLNISFAEEELDNVEIRTNLNRWMEVVKYYSIRLMMAPVVETLILLDRMMFLFEHDADAILMQLFDPELSPRNHVIMAKK